MRRIKLLAVLALLVLVLGGGLAGVIAQAPPSPGASGPVTTRTSYEEWVTQQTETGEVRVLVTVHEVKVVETVVITPAPPAEH
jgi:hypothetical protein